MATVGSKRSSPIDDSDFDHQTQKRYKPNGTDKWVIGRSKKEGGREYWYIQNQIGTARWCDEWTPDPEFIDESVALPSAQNLYNAEFATYDETSVTEECEDGENDDMETRLNKFYKKKTALEEKIKHEEQQLLASILMEVDAKIQAIQKEHMKMVNFKEILTTKLEKLK